MSRIIWVLKTPSSLYLNLLTLILFIGLLIGSLSRGYSQQETTTIKIECISTQADFVTLVWGFNGWKVPEDFNFSPPTQLEKNSLRTPMTQRGDTFSVELEMPVGKILNWGFLIGKNNGRKNKYFDQKSLLIDTTMAPIFHARPLTATDEELGYSTIPPKLALSLIGLFLVIGLLFIFSSLGKKLGFEPYGDYQLRVPMRSQFTYSLLIIVALINIVVLLGSTGYTHYYRALGENWESGSQIKYFLVQFSLEGENNGSVWYSSMIFLLTGLVSLLTFWGVFNVRDNKAQIRTAWGWIILAGLFVGLSADELGSIHERLGMMGELNFVGEGAPGWVDLFAIPGVIIGLFMLWFFFQNFRKQRKSFFILLLGILALLSTFLQEDFEISSKLASPDPELWRRPIWQLILEEGTELLAAWCFLGAFVNLVYRLSLQKSLQNSLEEPEITIKVKPAILVGLPFVLIAFCIFGVGLLSPLLEFGIVGGDNGITSNWFPSMLAFIAAVLSWLNWNSGRDIKRTEYLVLGLTLLGLSLYYGADFRNWFDIPIYDPFLFIEAYEVLMVIGFVYFIIKRAIIFPRTWQIISFVIWCIGISFAFFYPDSITGLRDLWPFAFLFPVLLTQWMEEAE